MKFVKKNNKNQTSQWEPLQEKKEKPDNIWSAFLLYNWGTKHKICKHVTVGK